MTSMKYDHFQVNGTITRKFHQNPLKTVGGVAETRLCLRTDVLTDGRTDEPKTIVSFDLRRGTISAQPKTRRKKMFYICLCAIEVLYLRITHDVASRYMYLAPVPTRKSRFSIHPRSQIQENPFR